MKTDDFETNLKSWFTKGAKASKKAFETVGDKVQNFTDKSVVKFERKQLYNKLEIEYLEMGKKLSSIISNAKKNNGDSELDVSKFSELEISEEDKKTILNIQSDIESLKLQIIEKDNEISQAD